MRRITFRFEMWISWFVNNLLPDSYRASTRTVICNMICPRIPNFSRTRSVLHFQNIPVPDTFFEPLHHPFRT